ncbi:MAG: rhodanese-like domain-containing protein [Gammaproteobacteria bacterium]
MNTLQLPEMLGAAVLLLASGALALYGQPDLEQKWEYLAPAYEPRLVEREVYIDPAELLHLMNDDYIHLVIYDVRTESDWNEFHLVDANRVSLHGLQEERDRLRSLPENAVVVVVSNDEILATEAWKRLMVVAKPNAYILEGGLNLWLNIYGVPEEETGSHGKASLGKPDGTLRHMFKLALGDRHAAAQPDEHLVPQREYTPKVKLMKKIAKASGCG